MRPYQQAYVRHQRIREAFEPRSLAGVETTNRPVGYTQSLRRLRAQQSGMDNRNVMSLSGLGDSSTQQIVMSAPQIAGSTATGIIGGAVKAGTLAANSAWATIGIPVIGAAVVGVTMWLSAMYKRGAQKEAATNIVDQIEVQLKANLDGYLNGPRTVESQLQALANFDAGWDAVVQNCSNPELGSAGQRCISERQQGGIAPWCTTPDKRGCDWFTRYRDPIANDVPVQTPNVLQGEGLAVDTINTLLGGNVQVAGMTIDNKIIFGVGAIILALALTGGKK